MGAAALKSVTPPPNLLAFGDYREFLAAFYRHRKSQRAGFSFRSFAEKAGFSSPNYLQLVIQGKRNLSTDSAPRVARALGLKSSEAAYFVALVRNANASSGEDRERSERERLRLAKVLVAKTIPTARAEVLSKWYLLPIRELCLFPDFEASGDWISAKLRGLVTPGEAEEGLRTLLRAGFLVERGGRLVCEDPVVETPPDGFDALRVLGLHRETLATWIRLLEGLATSERELGLVNIPISKDKLPELKRRVRAFQDEIIGWLQDEKNPEELVQLGSYVVPISR